MQSDEAALHAAIADRPHDDTPHLVLADYYDDNDRPDLAAMHRFITDPTHPGKYAALVAAHGGDKEAVRRHLSHYASGLSEGLTDVKGRWSHRMLAAAAHNRNHVSPAPEYVNASRAHTAAAVAEMLGGGSASTPDNVTNDIRRLYTLTNPSAPGVNEHIYNLPTTDRVPGAAWFTRTARAHERIARMTAGTHPPLHVLNTVAARIHREAAARLRG